ncbi:MFS transporter [Virgibacillus sp. LDC-1]|uniref:MFS transporter n=1 Tax=Virgibacillus sp. LDC-1 TaxID=3039856 RepID=UPI0024DE8165|nr:MFS transporter [Virgibacillus sp. LDC-1]
MKNWMAWKEEANYQKLFWAGLANGIGNRFNQVALLSLLYMLTESGIAIGLYFTIRMVPFLVMAPLGGMLADKFSKKALLITIDVIRIPIALLPLVVHHPDVLWIAYLGVFLLATGEAMYAPVRMATIPAIVKQDKLLYINAIEQIMLGAVLVVGSTTGGVIAFLLGSYVPFILHAFTFLVSALLLSNVRIKKVKQQKRQTPNEKRPSSWKLVIGSSALIMFLFMELTMPLANGIDNVLISVYALDVFNMGDIGVGLMYGFLGLGFIISSFFSHHLKNRLISLIVLFIAFEGIGHLLLSISPTFVSTLFIVFGITLAGGISNICLSTIIMKLVPASYQGSFFGLTQMISNTTLGIMMGVAGFLLEMFTPRQLSLLVGCMYVFFSLLYGFMFSRLSLKTEKRKLARTERL